MSTHQSSSGESVQKQVRDLETHGVDALRIEVEGDEQGTMAETQHTADQALRPLGRALAGFAVGVVLGGGIGAAIAAIAGFQIVIGILVGAIAGALLGGLNALYSRLPMSSTAFDADGSGHAKVVVRNDSTSR